MQKSPKTKDKRNVQSTNSRRRAIDQYQLQKMYRSLKSYQMCYQITDNHLPNNSSQRQTCDSITIDAIRSDLAVERTNLLTKLQINSVDLGQCATKQIENRV